MEGPSTQRNKRNKVEGKAEIVRVDDGDMCVCMSS